MSAIQENLEKIRTAVYGIEVRDAIHDSIETCYTDVTNAKTLADQSVASANSAASNANSKASLADSAATKANQALTQLEEALSNVESAVDSVNEAISRTTEAVTNTNAAIANANTAATGANEAKQSAEAAAAAATSAKDSALSAAASVTTVIAEANSARDAANLAASNAETAVASANSAVSNANTAATNADSKATTANAAASRADISSANADAAAIKANSAADQATASAQNADAKASSAFSASEAANNAATNANYARDSANTAAAAANSAASKANTSASNADLATSSCNTAIYNANVSTTSATRAGDRANLAAAAIEGMTVTSQNVGPDDVGGVSITEVEGHKNIHFRLKQGQSGAPYIIKGTAFPSISDLESTISSPAIGDQYNVGTEPPYNVYRWTGTSWEDQGAIGINIQGITNDEIDAIRNDEDITTTTGKYLNVVGLKYLVQKDKEDLNAKVDKISGKGLSTNDFTNEYKGQIETLGDNVSTLVNTKVDKVSGKGLSTNDFTDEYKEKLDQNVIDDSVTNSTHTWSSQKISDTQLKLEGSSTPSPMGTANVGTATTASKSDHVHPLPDALPITNGGTGKKTVADVNQVFKTFSIVGTASDANTSLKIGIYGCTTTTKNIPVATYGALVNISSAYEFTNSTGSIDQMFFPIAGGRIWRRSNYNTNAWSEWTLAALDAYPVGSIYMSYSSTSPASIFGGTWTQIKDRFLVGAGNSYSAGNTGGSNSVTLTGAHLPASQVAPVRSSDRFVTMCTPSDTPDGYITPASSGTLPLYWGTNWGTRVIGDGDSHENRPPYYAVYMWRRTK